MGMRGRERSYRILHFKDNPTIAARGGVGPNAGHTIEYQGKTLKLRMLPSAVVNEKTRLLVGAGVLVDPQVFLREVAQTGCQSRARVDRNCAIIESKHISMDKEGYLKDTIGTTGTGTAPQIQTACSEQGRSPAKRNCYLEYLEDVAESVNLCVGRE